MNPQEQNKAKAPYQNQTVSPSGVQKSELPKEPIAANIHSDAKGKDAAFVKPTDKDATECSTTKGSCGSK